MKFIEVIESLLVPIGKDIGELPMEVDSGEVSTVRVKLLISESAGIMTDSLMLESERVTTGRKDSSLLLLLILFGFGKTVNRSVVPVFEVSIGESSHLFWITPEFVPLKITECKLFLKHCLMSINDQCR